MKILIIATWFPPDTAIAAVRPYMFAKKLSKLGHDVTVLRSGAILCPPDKSLTSLNNRFKVISAIGKDSPADRIEQGEEYIIPKRKLSFLPEAMREFVVIMSKGIMEPRYCFLCYRRYLAQRKMVSLFSGKHFDIVFSTYGELENVFAGQYAAKMLSCKLIQDFRDPLVLPRMRSRLWNFCMRPVEKRAVQKADACITVAEAATRQMEQYGTGTRCVTIHNGYERSRYKKNDISVRRNQLLICYTGSVYPDRREAAVRFFESIKSMIEKEEIDRNNIRFVYAGGVGAIWKEILKKMNLEEIYEDHGYLSRDETERLQRESDIYLVLSWNCAENQGVISGKFYEGIRAEKPILSVISGALPNSELYQMNEKYHYGYCFEEVRGEEEVEKLKQYLLNAYNQKMETGKVDYQQNPALEEDFCYENLAKKLENLCYELIGEKQK